jgi:hypothetical protein
VVKPLDLGFTKTGTHLGPYYSNEACNLELLSYTKETFESSERKPPSREALNGALIMCRGCVLLPIRVA